MHEDLRKQLERKLSNYSPEEPPVVFSGRQFLAFKVADQHLLIAADAVREIVMPPPITYVPKAQKEVEGLIALRGEIMPVVNLRRMLGFSQGSLTASTRCLVVCPSNENFVLLVDEIVEFLWLMDEDIDSVDHDYLSAEFAVISGVAKSSSSVRPVIDVRLILQAVFEEGASYEQSAN